MPVPDTCPVCDAVKGEDYENLPAHLRNSCPGTGHGDSEGADA